MFIQCKQAECCEDKKKTVNGRNVVGQVDLIENYISVDFIENYISVEQDSANWYHSQVTLFTVCA